MPKRKLSSPQNPPSKRRKIESKSKIVPFTCKYYFNCLINFNELSTFVCKTSIPIVVLKLISEFSNGKTRGCKYGKQCKSHNLDPFCMYVDSDEEKEYHNVRN